MKFFLYLFGLIAFCAVAYWSFKFERTMNYSLSYKDMVKETIAEKVKAECLK